MEVECLRSEPSDVSPSDQAANQTARRDECTNEDIESLLCSTGPDKEKLKRPKFTSWSLFVIKKVG